MANIVPVKKNNNEKKELTLDEYIDRYTQPKRTKEIKAYFYLLVCSLGIIIGILLFFFVQKLFEIHKIAGFIGIGASVLVFIFLFIIPIVKVTKTKFFITEVDYTNARAAQKYNKQMREEIADKMIDLNVSTKTKWYSDEKIAPVAIARSRKDDKALSEALTDIYNTDVKKACNKIITDSAIQVGISTSLSQSERLDTAIVTISEINLIRKIIYLYGYRPNDTQMIKIYKTVLVNAFLAYGAQSATTSLTSGVAKLVGTATEGIPIISTVIGSVSSGAINGLLTVMVGFQTMRYLKNEYKLQNILADVIIDESAEAEAIVISQVKKDILKYSKKKAA